MQKNGNDLENLVPCRPLTQRWSVCVNSSHRPAPCARARQKLPSILLAMACQFSPPFQLDEVLEAVCSGSGLPHCIARRELSSAAQLRHFPVCPPQGTFECSAPALPAEALEGQDEGLHCIAASATMALQLVRHVQSAKILMKQFRRYSSYIRVQVRFSSWISFDRIPRDQI